MRGWTRNDTGPHAAGVGSPARASTISESTSGPGSMRRRSSTWSSMNGPEPPRTSCGGAPRRDCACRRTGGVACAPGSKAGAGLRDARCTGCGRASPRPHRVDARSAHRDLSHPGGAAPGDRQNAHGASVFLDVKSDDAFPRAWNGTKTGRDFVPPGSTIRVVPEGVRIRVKGDDFPCDGSGCREIEQKGHDASDVPVHEWMPDNLKPGHRRDALPAPLRGSSRNLPGRVPRTPRQELPHGGGFLPPSPPV